MRNHDFTDLHKVDEEAKLGRVHAEIEKNSLVASKAMKHESFPLNLLTAVQHKIGNMMQSGSIVYHQAKKALVNAKTLIGKGPVFGAPALTS